MVKSNLEHGRNRSRRESDIHKSKSKSRRRKDIQCFQRGKKGHIRQNHPDFRKGSPKNKDVSSKSTNLVKGDSENKSWIHVISLI